MNYAKLVIVILFDEIRDLTIRLNNFVKHELCMIQN